VNQNLPANRFEPQTGCEWGCLSCEGPGGWRAIALVCLCWVSSFVSSAETLLMITSHSSFDFAFMVGLEGGCRVTGKSGIPGCFSLFCGRVVGAMSWQVHSTCHCAKNQLVCLLPQHLKSLQPSNFTMVVTTTTRYASATSWLLIPSHCYHNMNHMACNNANVLFPW